MAQTREQYTLLVAKTQSSSSITCRWRDYCTVAYLVDVDVVDLVDAHNEGVPEE